MLTRDHFSGVARWPGLAATALWLLAACATAPVPQNRTSSVALTADLAITNANIVDVVDGAVLRDRTVLVAGPRIVQVDPAGGIAVPVGAKVVKASGA